MQTAGFEAGIQQLMELAQEQGPVALMCAETVYWQCHRALLSDALTARGWQVLHIISKDKAPYPHKVTKFAKFEGETVTYPAYQSAAEEGGQGSGAGGKRSGGKHRGPVDAKQPRIDSFFKAPHQLKQEQQGAPPE
ncbi:hypothetical protein N2152v2_009012 [Parachlorella kessleri]